MCSLLGHHSSESRKTLHPVLPQNQIVSRTELREWEAMASRIKNEKTFSGHTATGGTHTVDQSTAPNPGQLYYLKQCQASHPFSLTGPTTI
jgi:hypothetical protein